jgi:hypothetical protein
MRYTTYINLQYDNHKGMEKMQLLERAEEALLDARLVYQNLNGPMAKSTLISCVHLANCWKMTKGREAQAEKLLSDSLGES